MYRVLLPLVLHSCTPSAQLKQLCESQYDRCSFGTYGRLARMSHGEIQIDRRTCDRDWPLCAFAIEHEIGHARGAGSEIAANCYAYAHSELPARRASEELFGSGWYENTCFQ